MESALHIVGYEIYSRPIVITEQMQIGVASYINGRSESPKPPPKKKSRKTKKRSNSTTQIIFNNKRNSTGDGLRMQTPVSGNALGGLTIEIMKWAEQNFPEHSMNDMVVLTSKPGCKQQVPHCDYEPSKELADCDDAHYPLGCIIAVEKFTKIVVWPRTIRLSTMHPDFAESLMIGGGVEPFTVYLNPGDIFVFRGDLVHAGAAYATFNNRIHIYLDSPLVSRTQNRTWYPPSEWLAIEDAN